MVAIMFSVERVLEGDSMLPGVPFPLAGEQTCGVMGGEVDGEPGDLCDGPGLL